MDIFEKETDDNFNTFSNLEIQCLDCKCFGTLRKVGDQVILFTEEVLSTRSINTQESDLKKKRTWKRKINKNISLSQHGFATNKQKYTYTILGGIFWMTIVLIANFASLENLKLQTTFLTSTCHRSYKQCIQIESMDLCGHLMKQCHATEEFILPKPVTLIKPKESEIIEFSEEENKVNLRRCKKKRFLDQKVCRHLCANTLILKSTRTHSITPCESICFELTRSFKSSGAVCPTEKYCKNGCPCPFYKCEKTENDQKLVPAFDLKNGDYRRVVKSRNGMKQAKAKKQAVVLFDFSGAQTKKNNSSIEILFDHYERF